MVLLSWLLFTGVFLFFILLLLLLLDDPFSSVCEFEAGWLVGVVVEEEEEGEEELHAVDQVDVVDELELDRRWSQKLRTCKWDVPVAGEAAEVVFW